MNRKLIQISAVVGIAVLFLAAGIYAKDVPDLIKLEDPAYEKHKKGVVDFTHGKHQTEYAEQYPEFYKNGCGECHHDEDNKPLSDLKAGDEVQKCIECHKIASEVPKDRMP
jgi:cytochrome c553